MDGCEALGQRPWVGSGGSPCWATRVPSRQGTEAGGTEQHCSCSQGHVFSSNPHRNPAREEGQEPLRPLYSGANGGSEQLRGFPIVVETVSPDSSLDSVARSETQA